MHTGKRMGPITLEDGQRSCCHRSWLCNSWIVRQDTHESESDWCEVCKIGVASNQNRYSAGRRTVLLCHGTSMSLRLPQIKASPH